MAQYRDEQISAMLDGELHGAELHQAVDALGSEPDLMARWARYNLVSDALRNNLPDDPRHDLASRVTAALESEPTVLAPKRALWHLPGYLKQAAGLAIAASVTAIAILGVQNMGGEVAEVMPAAVVASSSANGEIAAPPAMNVSMTSEQAAPPVTRGDDVGLDPYLVNHNEYSISSGMHGMLPYVRIVSQESDR